jgi:hypothetical protein
MMNIVELRICPVAIREDPPTATGTGSVRISQSWLLYSCCTSAVCSIKRKVGSNMYAYHVDESASFFSSGWINRAAKHAPCDAVQAKTEK